jgi:hypothetical protein
VSVVCCHVEFSATSWSLVQRSPAECGVSQLCVIMNPRKMRRPRPPRGCRAIGKKIYFTMLYVTWNVFNFSLFNIAVSQYMLQKHTVEVTLFELGQQLRRQGINTNFSNETSCKSATLNMKKKVHNRMVLRMKNKGNCFKIVSTGRFGCCWRYTSDIQRVTYTLLSAICVILHWASHNTTQSSKETCCEQKVIGKASYVHTDMANGKK